MAAWLAGIGQTVLEETAIPGSSLGIAVLAAGIFAVVLASLYVVAALIRRWRREKQDPVPPTAVSGPFTAPDEDWDFSGGDS